MADLEPTMYDVKAELSEQGMNQGDLHRAVYNLYKCVEAICNNIDEDSGNTGTDYMSKIGTDLVTAMAKLQTPSGGPVT